MELEPAGSDSDSDDGFYEACLAASRRLVTRKAPAPTPPAPTPPPKTAGGKRKLGDLPTGIRMHQKTQFRITVRDVVTSKKTSRTYKTLEEAEAAYAAERALQAEHKRQKAARPQAEIRAENLARHGNNSKLERDFATALHAADSKIETMNDSVLADSCGFFYDAEPQLALGIQLKVAEKPEKSNGSLWVFGNVNHYPRMPVVCWRADKQDGWIYDGTDLVERKRECLGVTPGGINDALAINTDDERTRATPLPLDRIIARLRELAADRKRFPPHTKAFLSWQFGGKKAHKQLKERIGLHLEELRDPGSTFPEAQNGSYDQLGSDGVTRRQLKTGCMRAGRDGWGVHLAESAGKVNGTQKWRPYPAGVFDEVVVYVPDLKTMTARRWRTPESKPPPPPPDDPKAPRHTLKSKGYLRTDTDTGKRDLYVYQSPEPPSKYTPFTDTWTAAYYEGMVPVVLPPEAWEASGHLLEDLRSGRVK